MIFLDVVHYGVTRSSTVTNLLQNNPIIFVSDYTWNRKEKISKKKIKQKVVRWTSQSMSRFAVCKPSLYIQSPTLPEPYNRGRCHHHATLLACYPDPLPPFRPQTKTPITHTHKYDRFRLCFVRAAVVVAVVNAVVVVYRVWPGIAGGELWKLPCWLRRKLYRYTLLPSLLLCGAHVRCEHSRTLSDETGIPWSDAV